MIPAEAVEAAAKVFYQDGWEGPPFWESRDHDDPSRLEYLSTARAALEAAAPYLHRTVSTIEGLNALSAGSVIMGFDEDGTQLVSVKSVDGYWQEAGTDNGWQAEGIIQWYGSVTVLHEGTARYVPHYHTGSDFGPHT